MYSWKISVLLSALPTFLKAQQLLRAGGDQPPAPTAAALFLHQNAFICPAGQTSCLDGSGGCCSFGVACTSSRGKPVCDEACGIGPTCADFGCCHIGYTCDYKSTLCVSTTFDLNSPSSIGASVSVTSTTASSSTIRSKSPPSTSPTSTVTPAPTIGTVVQPSSSSLSNTISPASSQEQSTSASTVTVTKSASTSNGAPTSIIPQSSTTPTSVTFTGNGQGEMGLYMSMLLLSCGLVLFRVLQ